MIKVVRFALIRFLEKQKIENVEEKKLSKLAKEESIIILKAAKPLKAGQVVRTSDFDLGVKK